MRLASTSFALAAAIALSACSSARPRRAVTMERLSPPPEAAKRRIVVHVDEAVTIAFAVESIADDPSLVRSFIHERGVTVVGKKLGATILRVREQTGPVARVELEVVAGEPAARTIVVGETITIPMTGVKQYAVGDPAIVEVVVPTDGKKLLVTGKKPGMSTILLLRDKGEKQVHELDVVGGRRID